MLISFIGNDGHVVGVGVSPDYDDKELPPGFGVAIAELDSPISLLEWNDVLNSSGCMGTAASIVVAKFGGRIVERQVDLHCVELFTDIPSQWTVAVGDA